MALGSFWLLKHGQNLDIGNRHDENIGRRNSVYRDMEKKRIGEK